MPTPSTSHSAARALVLLSLAAPLACTGRGTVVETGPAPAAAGGAAAITEAELREHVFAFADDSMLGRRAGTEGNLKSTAYIEREVRRLGLQPAGENGTYFQSVPLVRRGPAADARVLVNGTPLEMWSDVIAMDAGPGARALGSTRAIYAGSLADTASLIPPSAGAGKVVVGRVMPGMPFAATLRALHQRYPQAAAVALTNADRLMEAYAGFFRSGSTFLAGSPQDATTGPDLAPVLLLTTSASARIFGGPVEGLRPGAEGATISGDVRFVREPLQARNVVAVVPGSDPAMRGQYVALGAHSDHVGVEDHAVDHDSLRAFHQQLRALGATDPFSQVDPQRRAQIRVNVDSLRAIRPARRDSINNGADDDASGSMALLEIAERFALGNEKPRRSLLFVWHTAEELGLYGSEWYTDNPTVPRDSIVAALNLDMIGRGGADDIAGGGATYLQLVGSRRLSTELGDLVETVNARQALPFRFDYGMDATGHPEQIYCRSDHWNYARYGIPVVFFTSGQHMDYHQVTDEPQYVNYERLTRVTRLIADVALEVANRPSRPTLSVARPDPNAPCRQ